MQKKIGYGFVIIYITILAIGFGIDHQNQTNLEDYWNSNNLQYHREIIPVDAHIDLYGMLYLPANLSVESLQLSTQSPESGKKYPFMLHVNGMNRQKESNIDHPLSFVKQGFVVLAIELRGHGQSGGRATFYAEEPKDISKVIDYIEAKYPMLNTTHIAASGFSYGAGSLLIAQTFESRIYTSVLYHPVTNFTGLVQDYSIEALVGPRYLYPPDDAGNLSLLAARDAFSYCTPENTENLLLLQGDEDTVLNPNDTIALYNSIASPERHDLQLIIREGLGHGSNERNITSRQMAMAWFTKFYFSNASFIDAEHSEALIDFQADYNEMITFSYRPPVSENVFTYYELSFVLGVCAFLFGLFSFKSPKQYSAWLNNGELSIQEFFDPIPSSKSKKWLIIQLFGIGFLWSLFNRVVSPNVIFGLLLLPLVLGTYSIVYLILKSRKSFEKTPVKNVFHFIGQYFLLVLGFAIPLLVMQFSKDLSDLVMIQETTWIWHPVLPLITFSLLGTVLSLELIATLIKSKLNWLIFVIFCLVGTFYLVLNPFPPIDGYNTLISIFPFLLGLVFWVVSLMTKLARKIVKMPEILYVWLGVYIIITLLSGSFNFIY